eukprot:4931495-Amphidinium_carterae.1
MRRTPRMSKPPATITTTATSTTTATTTTTAHPAFSAPRQVTTHAVFHRLFPGMKTCMRTTY